nr:zinc finger, CCHC-type [Tanacetum cinerariifolium]
PKRNEKAGKERNLNPDFIDSKAIIFLVECDNENNVVNKIPVLLNVPKQLGVDGYLELNKYHTDGSIQTFKARCIYSKFTKDYVILICLYVDDILIVGTNMEEEANTPYESSCKLVESDGRVVAQIEYVSAIGYSNASWITGTSDSKSITGWGFTLGGGLFFEVQKKQTCITHSTIEGEFLALVVAGKKAKWLRNILLDVELWPQPKPTIFLHCDSRQRYRGHIIRCIMESLDTLALDMPISRS